MIYFRLVLMSSVNMDTFLHNAEIDDDARMRQKSRVRDRYAGRTYKHAINWNNQKNPRVDVSRPINTAPGDGNIQEISVSQVDHDIKPDSPYIGREFVENGAKLWKTFNQSIKQHATSIKKTHYLYNNSFTEEFTVPVVDTVDFQIDPTKKPVAEKNWFNYNGKSYDTQFLYKPNDSFTVFTALAPLDPVFTPEDESISELKPSYSRFDDSMCYVVNFNKPHNITHIGTIGDKPYIIKFNSKHFSLTRSRKKHISRAEKWISVVDKDYPTSYVTSYKLEYFDSIIKTWIYIGKFSGNIDAYNLHVNKLEQKYTTKAIKITVLDFKVNPFMRIKVYGAPVLTLASKATTAATEDTIKYTLTYPPKLPVSYNLRSRRYDSFWRKDLIAKTKRDINNIIKEDHDIKD